MNSFLGRIKLSFLFNDVYLNNFHQFSPAYETQGAFLHRYKTKRTDFGDINTIELHNTCMLSLLYLNVRINIHI